MTVPRPPRGRPAMGLLLALCLLAAAGTAVFVGTHGTTPGGSSVTPPVGWTFAPFAATVSLTPGTGPVGSSATAIGGGFPPGLTASLTWDVNTNLSCTSGSLLTSSSGVLNCTFTVPAGAAGGHAVAAAAGGSTASATFTTTSKVTTSVPSSPVWNRNATAPIGLVLLNATGLPVGSYTASLGIVAITNWTNCTGGSYSGPTVATDTLGGLLCIFGVPVASGGAHKLSILSGATTEASTSLTVTPTFYACSAASGSSAIPTCSSQGPVGSPVQFYGTGFVRATGVVVAWGATTGSPCPATTTDPHGAFTCGPYPVPVGPNVPVNVTANETTSTGPRLVSTSFDVTSTLQVGIGLSTPVIDAGQSVRFDANASSGVAPYGNYSWTFGDGTNGSGPAVSHTYGAAGVYEVAVVVTDNVTSTASDTVNVTVYGTPTADSPQVSRSSADVSQPFDFVENATPGNESSGPLSYQWVLDSHALTGLSCGVSTSAQLQCLGTAPGAFTVNVTVADPYGGNANATSQSVTIIADPTVSLPEIAPAAIDVGQQTTISVNVTGGAGGLTYLWMGSENGCTGTMGTLICHPTTTGIFPVSVRVSDSNGFVVTSRSADLTVSPALTVSLAGNPVGFPAQQNVSFTASVSGGTNPITLAWALGDGATASGTSASHAFASPGSYTVHFWANDSAGASVNESWVVTVTVVVPPVSSTLLGQPESVGLALLVAIAVLLLGAGVGVYTFGLRRKPQPSGKDGGAVAAVGPSRPGPTRVSDGAAKGQSADLSSPPPAPGPTMIPTVTRRVDEASTSPAMSPAAPSPAAPSVMIMKQPDTSSPGAAAGSQPLPASGTPGVVVSKEVDESAPAFAEAPPTPPGPPDVVITKQVDQSSPDIAEAPPAPPGPPDVVVTKQVDQSSPDIAEAPPAPPGPPEVVITKHPDQSSPGLAEASPAPPGGSGEVGSVPGPPEPIEPAAPSPEAPVGSPPSSPTAPVRDGTTEGPLTDPTGAPDRPNMGSPDGLGDSGSVRKEVDQATPALIPAAVEGGTRDDPEAPNAPVSPPGAPGAKPAPKPRKKRARRRKPKAAAKTPEAAAAEPAPVPAPSTEGDPPPPADMNEDGRPD